MSRRVPRFEVYRSWGLRGPEYRWRLIAGNGEKVASGEGHRSRSDALRSAYGVRGLAGSTPVIDDQGD